jgi:hypothetical protein
MALIRVQITDLANQLKRKGFEILGHDGKDGVCKPRTYTLHGDDRKLSNREKPYCHIVGKLTEKGEGHGPQS